MVSRLTVSRRRLGAGLLALPALGHIARAGDGPRLARGVNASAWFSNSRERQPLAEADLRQIRAAGFDHIRLPVRPEWFGYDPRSDGAPTAATFRAVEAAVEAMLASGLAVLLCLQLGVDNKPVLETDDRAEARYIALGVAVARRLAAYPADRVAFEPINEFDYWNAMPRYARFQARLVKAVRVVLPGHMIVLTFARGSGVRGIDDGVLVDDANVAYAFHFYEPYIVTHQGVAWGFPNSAIHWFRGVPYPSSLVRVGADYAPGAPDPAKAARELATYVAANWDAAAVAAPIRVAADWAARTRVRLLCTEFGALRLHIDPASRYRWIADARKALETNGIGWSLWDYTDIFGITDLTGPTRTDAATGEEMLVSLTSGGRSIQPAALRALLGGSRR